VRRNSGGADPLGIEIASRLTGVKYLTYSKVTCNNIDGPLHFTEPPEFVGDSQPGAGLSGRLSIDGSGHDQRR